MFSFFYNISHAWFMSLEQLRLEKIVLYYLCLIHDIMVTNTPHHTDADKQQMKLMYTTLTLQGFRLIC
jgi:hypothetical protein